MMTIRETIMSAAAAAGWSAYRLAQAADMPARTVQHFFNGSRDLTSARIDKLAAALRLELRPARRQVTKGKR